MPRGLAFHLTASRINHNGLDQVRNAICRSHNCLVTKLKLESFNKYTSILIMCDSEATTQVLDAERIILEMKKRSMKNISRNFTEPLLTQP